MRSILKSITPFGITSGSFHFNFRKFIKNLMPTIIVEKIIEKNKSIFYAIDYLKNNYVSDLTDNEKWSLLAILLFLEQNSGEINYLEIGIYAGGTIKFLKQNSKLSSFTGIDLFEDFRLSDANTHMWKNYTIDQVSEALGKDRVTLYKGDSVVVLNNLQKTNKKFDFIFIDGNHTFEATKNDYTASLPLLKKGGYIAFHNCSPGMTQEDKYYLKLDGGPWMLTHELILEDKLQLVITTDRVRIFKNNIN